MDRKTRDLDSYYSWIVHGLRGRSVKFPQHLIQIDNLISTWFRTCVRASNICSRSGPSQCLGNCDTPRTMSLLDTIVPVVADNTYNGHPAVIWYVRNPNLTYLTYAIRITDTIDSRILWLVTAYNIWRSLTHWLKYDGGAQSIGRIPLDTGSSFIFHWNTTLRDPNSAVIFTILIT